MASIFASVHRDSGGAAIASKDDIRRALNRLTRERLVSECELRLAPPNDWDKDSNDGPWDHHTKPDLVLELMQGLDETMLYSLMADGIAQTKAPSVGGPSWHFEPGALSSDQLKRELTNGLLIVTSDQIRDLRIEFRSSDLLDASFSLLYRQLRFGVRDRAPVDYEVFHEARATFDLSDGVLTVSSDVAEHAIRLGEALLDHLKLETAERVELNLSTTLSSKQLSTTCLGMFEAVFGRIGSVAEIIYTDKIWTKRREAEAKVKDETARGEGMDVLEDSRKRRDLLDGDDLIGMRFVIKYTYPFQNRTRIIRAKVTLGLERDGMILKLSRGDYAEDRMIALYHQIRRSLLASTNKVGKDRTRAVISRITATKAA